MGREDLPHSRLILSLLVWLNMHQYPWISLNILENTWINPVLTMPGLWIYLIILHVCAGFLNIWHGCICKAYTRLWICLNMAHMPQQCLNIPQYALISFNMSYRDWILLIVPEYAWKCVIELFWLFQGFEYASAS